MIDIIDVTDGQDLGMLNSAIKRAENLLAVQLGDLEYAEDWGVDLNFFLSEDYAFQNESFKSYLLQRMAEESIDVSSVSELVTTFYNKLIFELSEVNDSDSLIR
jgi:hypothetical protein